MFGGHVIPKVQVTAEMAAEKTAYNIIRLSVSVVSETVLEMLRKK